MMGRFLLVYLVILGFVTAILGNRPWLNEISAHVVGNTKTRPYHFQLDVALQNPVMKILWIIWGVLFVIHLLAGGHSSGTH